MDHSLRLSIKWLKKWESQKEISYRFLAYLLFAGNISVSGKANYTAYAKCWFNIGIFRVV